IWRAQPVCLREAWVDSRTRLALESELAVKLRDLPPDTTLLMYLGDHVGALQQAGIPLRRVINEGNHRTWRRPSDPAGQWERALADPGQYADYAIAFAGDPVSMALAKHSLPVVAQVDVPGQPQARIYRTRPNTISSVSRASNHLPPRRRSDDLGLTRKSRRLPQSYVIWPEPPFCGDKIHSLRFQPTTCTQFRTESKCSARRW